MNKKYVELSLKLDWYKLLPALKAEQIFMLNKGKDDFIVGWGTKSELTQEAGKFDPDGIQFFLNEHQGDYIFTYLSYDIKNNETRPDSTPNQRSNDAHFLVPEHVLVAKGNSLLYFGERSKTIIEKELNALLNQPLSSQLSDFITLIPSTSKEEYFTNIEQIKSKIQAGIIYEMNYCVDYSGSFQQLNPYQTYEKLIGQSNAPFSCFVKHNEHFVLSASPERFMVKKDQKIASQPIKGTAKRGLTTAEDLEIATRLSNDSKEISENVMIVDLVRNDLSKLAQKNSVYVEELCKLYTFETVHQLISTISCQLDSKHSFTDILQALFPMGSMTGAPKISAIQQINVFENFQRGIYSGSVGYIEPNGNFDFNVIIRTILVNLKSKSVNCRVGGAITIHSIAEKEYQECLLKLRALELSLC